MFFMHEYYPLQCNESCSAAGNFLSAVLGRIVGGWLGRCRFWYLPLGDEASQVADHCFGLTYDGEQFEGAGQRD